MVIRFGVERKTEGDEPYVGARLKGSSTKKHREASDDDFVHVLNQNRRLCTLRGCLFEGVKHKPTQKDFGG